MRNFYKYIMMAVLAMIAAAAPRAGAQVNTDQVMRIGVNAMSFDDYILAIQYFNQVIQAKPYLSRPYHMRAIAKYNLEDYAGAEADATLALDINPYVTEVYRLRGAARQNIGRYEQAVDDYDHVLSADPRDQRVLFNKGLALASLHRYNDADSVLGHLIDMSPGLDMAYFGRANVALMMGDTISAGNWLDKGIAINPNDLNAHIMRYQIAVATPGADSTAIAALDKAIQLSPRTSDLYVARANLRYNTDDYFGAMADYSYALDLDPGNDRALYNRAMLRTEVNDLDNALDDYERILAADPDNDLAIYNHAMILAQKGDYRRAIDGISHFINLYPNLSTSYFVRSQWRLALGEKAAAKADYDKGRQLADYRRPIQRPVRRKSNLEKENERNAEARRDTVPTDIEEITPEEFERRLSHIIEIDNTAELDVQYDDSSIRGLIQNRNFNAETEPYMLISYYPTPSELQRKTYYLKEADDLNATHILRRNLAVTPMPAQPSVSDIQEHFASVEYFNSALATPSPRTADYIGRAMDFITLKNYEAAIDDIDRAIAITPDYALAYMLRAQARACATSDDSTPRATTLRLVLADLDKAIDLSPRSAVAWYNKGNVLFELADYTSAILAYTRAIERQPDMGEAYFNRGYANLKLGNAVAGKADLSKAGELGIVPAYNLLKRITTK